MGKRRPLRSERIFRRLVRLFPFDFRWQYGREMEDVFRMQHQGAQQQGGRMRVAKLWWRTLTGIFRVAPREHWEMFRQDTGYALRLMRKNLGFTGVIVATLALGIGANTAIFSVVNAVLLRPLPYKHPDRLVRIFHHNRNEDNLRDWVSPISFEAFQQQSQTLEVMAGISPHWSFVLTGEGDPERLGGYFASASLFPMLGVNPHLGRTFSPEEDQPGASPTVMLSHNLWLRRFGANSAVVGESVTIDGSSVTVVGVMPPGFDLLQEDEPVDLWVPLHQNPFVLQRKFVRLLTVVGRLQPGHTVQNARAELATLAAQLEQEYPDSNTGLGVSVFPLHEEMVGNVRPALLVLLGGVGFVLLIACANVANLLLSRAAVREKEIAIRGALGAGPARLVRQLLTESTLLGLLGGGAGLALAYWGVAFLRRWGPADLPRLNEVEVDSWVLGFALVASVLTGVLFGSVPALQAARRDLCDSLKEGGRASHAGGRRTRSALVVVEVALALMLLVGAGLLIRSFDRLMQVDPGFNPDNLLTLQVYIQGEQYRQPEARAQFYDALLERWEAVPGVVAAGGTTRIPMRTGVTGRLDIEGRAVPLGEQPQIEFRRVSKDYYRAMGIPVLRGRSFTDEDGAEAMPVAIINEAAARRHWPGEEPVGKRVRLSPQSPWLTIIGVIGNVKHFGLDTEAAPELYIHFPQGPPGNPLFAIRTSGDPTAMVAAVREVVRQMDPTLAVYNVASMKSLVSDSVAQRRFNMLLLSLFAAVALALGVVGVYGVISYSVSRQTHEIGIRMALGAQAGDVLRLVVIRGLLLTAAGVALGLAGAFAVTRFLESLLFGVTPTDAPTLALVSVLLLAAALAACYVPARRATKVDPMVALRYE